MFEAPLVFGGVFWLAEGRSFPLYFWLRGAGELATRLVGVHAGQS